MSLQRMAERAWPTQQSLYDANRVPDLFCLLCPGADGTFYHKVVQYAGTAELRKGRAARGAALPDHLTSAILHRFSDTAYQSNNLYLQ